MFGSLAIAASGLSAQRQRLETVAQNIANAETTRTADGEPYRRRVVRMEEGRLQPLTYEQQMYGGGLWAPAPFQPPTLGRPGVLGAPTTSVEEALGGVRVAAVEEDASEGPLVYDPGHPDADANGYVRYPNVRLTEELMDLMDARRMYEANATVFQVAKQILRRSIDL
jgi:flagellar basal-body rod protein FlgC